MSKKSRERKNQKLEYRKLEQNQIVERKKNRLQPVIELAKKFSLTLLATVVLLVVGYAVNKHLPAIVERLTASK